MKKVENTHIKNIMKEKYYNIYKTTKNDYYIYDGCYYKSSSDDYIRIWNEALIKENEANKKIEERNKKIDQILY